MSDSSTLGPFRLLARLGSGGMGEVWAAERLDGTGELVAVKTLAAGAHSPTALARLLDEARLVAALDHPNVVRLIEVGAHGERCYFAMEKLEGCTFADLAALRRPLPPAAVVGLALQVLAGLEYARTAPGPDGRPLGVVHRDLKPANLFLTRDGTAKLLDFGIARASLVDATQTRTGTFRGSLAYASPEHVRGEAQDARSDLFSLGLILHELLTGRRVFTERNEAALLGEVLWAPISPPHTVVPEVPRPLSDAVVWALERDASQRPQTPRDLATALERGLGAMAWWSPAELGPWLATLALPARPEPATASVHFAPLQPAPRAPPPLPSPPPVPPPLVAAVSRRRGLGLAAAAAGVVALGAAGWWLTGLVAARHAEPSALGAPSRAGQTLVEAATQGAVPSPGLVPAHQGRAAAELDRAASADPRDGVSPEPGVNEAVDAATSKSAGRGEEEAGATQPAGAAPGFEQRQRPDAELVGGPEALAGVDRAPVADSPASKSVLRPSRRAATAKAAATGATAWLTVDARPTWARIELDGRELGATPLVRLPLTPGRKRLVAVKEDGQRQERQVTLHAGLEERVLVLW